MTPERNLERSGAIVVAGPSRVLLRHPVPVAWTVVAAQEVKQMWSVARFADAKVSASKPEPTPNRSVTAPFVLIVPNVENPAETSSGV